MENVCLCNKHYCEIYHKEGGMTDFLVHYLLNLSFEMFIKTQFLKIYFVKELCFYTYEKSECVTLR